ncbi:MAG: M81 family metallopeptidase [Myxococcales bacterium]|nr:M81 family metallopeptidase [Myxococcales bacterium]
MNIPRYSDLGRGGRPLRIGYGRIFHEACAYSPVATVESDFRRLHHLTGADLHAATGARGSEIAGYMPHAELTGFRAAAYLAGDVDAVPLASSLAVPSGPLTAACFEWLVAGLEASLADAGPLDGIYLALHGSMQVEGLAMGESGQSPESIILSRVRAACPGARIAVSYDLHAHLTEGMVAPADILISYLSNPHWDLYPTGFRAGTRLIRALRGQIRPTSAWRKLPMVLGGGMTISFLSPMRQVFAAMAEMERRPKVVSTSLFMVHPYTDSDQLGWAVHVTVDGDAALASRVADELADLAWAQRLIPPPTMLSVPEALASLRSKKRRFGPVSIVDVDDIVGAGAPGGNTHILAALAADDTGLRTYVPLHDPGAIDALWPLADGTSATVTLQGSPGYGQPPVTVTGRVAAHQTGDFGRVLRFDTGTTHVAITERPPLPIHPKFWRELGLDPRKADALVQKNFFHYRIFYAPISFEHMPVVSAGATSLDRVRTRDYARPTHPQTHLESWRG